MRGHPRTRVDRILPETWCCPGKKSPRHLSSYFSTSCQCSLRAKLVIKEPGNVAVHKGWPSRSQNKGKKKRSKWMCEQIENDPPHRYYYYPNFSHKESETVKLGICSTSFKHHITLSRTHPHRASYVL